MSFSLIPELPLYSLIQWLHGQPRPIWRRMVTSFIQNIILPTHLGPLSTSLLTGSCWVSISVLHIRCDKPLITVGMDGCPTKTFLIAETASYNAPCKATPCMTFFQNAALIIAENLLSFTSDMTAVFVVWFCSLGIWKSSFRLKDCSHRFPNVEHALLPHVYCLLFFKKKS